MFTSNNGLKYIVYIMSTHTCAHMHTHITSQISELLGSSWAATSIRILKCDFVIMPLNDCQIFAFYSRECTIKINKSKCNYIILWEFKS